MMSAKDGRSPVADEASRETGAGGPGASDVSGGASIEKVRDILFGNQVREFERRFTRLEERILKETSGLKEQLTARVEALEAFTKTETASLAAQIRSEHDGRVEADATGDRAMKDAAAAQERRVSALDEQLARSQRETRQQLLEQNQRLSDDIRSKMDDVLAALAREARELRTDKADRATIAALLTEMAVRLTDDFDTRGDDASNG
jgi:hypothetical protein